EAKASGRIGYMWWITGKNHTADTVPFSRPLVRTIRGCSLESIRAVVREYRLVYVRQALQECLFRKRRVFHVGAAPEPFIAQNDDDRAEMPIDHEGRARIAMALEIAMDVGGHEPLRPCDTVERETELSAHCTCSTVRTNDPAGAQLLRFALCHHGERHPVSILLELLKSSAESHGRVR